METAATWVLVHLGDWKLDKWDRNDHWETKINHYILRSLQQFVTFVSTVTHHWLCIQHPKSAYNFQYSLSRKSDSELCSHCSWSLKGQDYGNGLHLQDEGGSQESNWKPHWITVHSLWTSWNSLTSDKNDNHTQRHEHSEKMSFLFSNILKIKFLQQGLVCDANWKEMFNPMIKEPMCYTIQ